MNDREALRKVDELRSQGELSGDVDADVVQLSGSVKDNTVIRAKSLEVKLSPPTGKLQVVFGDCTLDVGEGAAKTTDTTRDVAKAAAGAAKNSPPKPSVPPSAEPRARSVPPSTDGAV